MKRQFAFRLLIGVLAMLGLAACSDSDNFEAESVNDPHVYKISVTVNDNADSPQSRVLSLNEDNVVLSNWAQGDKILVFNCTDGDDSRETDYSKVTADDANTHKNGFHRHHQEQKNDDDKRLPCVLLSWHAYLGHRQSQCEGCGKK